MALLLFMELFVTYRGLSNPQGMEHAQLAREIARGAGLHTKVVRPYAWQQFIQHGLDVPVLELPDTLTPPLQPLVLAAVFHFFAADFHYDGKQTVYLMDRVVAATGLFFFLAAAGVMWFTARRLFDEKIAGWTFVALMVCQFLWDVARSGLPQMMALLLFTVAIHTLAVGMERTVRGQGAVFQSFVIGLMSALMVLTHWMAVWIVLGLVAVAAWQLRPRFLSAFCVGLPPLLALAGWAMRNHAVCGDYFGSVKATLQSTMVFFSDSWLMRDFTGQTPSALAEFVSKKLLTNLYLQTHDLFAHLGGMFPALFFFPALLHPFRKPEVRALARSLAVIWLLAMVGMAFTGLPAQERDANQIHSLFLPVMTMSGFAFIGVLWGRLGLSHPHFGWWRQHAAAAAACAVTALPMMVNLPTEVMSSLNAEGHLAHWPPYLPDRIVKIVSYVPGNEIVFSDVPWAVAWYADRTCAWLPMEQEQFFLMRDVAKRQNVRVGGLLLTPESVKGENLGEIFTGENHDWTPVILRGLIAGFGTDTLGQSDLPFREILPLAGHQPRNGRLVAEMTFMSDRRPWEHPEEPAPSKVSEKSVGSKVEQEPAR